jgi:peptidoglycan biosynthesis protein MviN/MurJ (putative lipid II flippase)
LIAADSRREFPAWIVGNPGESEPVTREKSRWKDYKLVSRAILRDRSARRKMIARMLLFALAQMAVGLWAIEGWLAQNPWRFLLWWGACAMVTAAVMIFAFYDALAVIREERDRFR